MKIDELAGKISVKFNEKEKNFWVGCIHRRSPIANTFAWIPRNREVNDLISAFRERRNWRFQKVNEKDVTWRGFIVLFLGKPRRLESTKIEGGNLKFEVNKGVFGVIFGFDIESVAWLPPTPDKESENYYPLPKKLYWFPREVELNKILMEFDKSNPDWALSKRL